MFSYFKNKSRKNYTEDLSSKLRKLYSTQSKKTNVREIAKDLGIAIDYLPCDSKYIIYFFDNKNPSIKIRKDISYKLYFDEDDIRFFIAYCLSYYFLNYDFKGEIKKYSDFKNSDDSKIKNAFNFAIDLLIDKNDFLNQRMNGKHRWELKEIYNIPYFVCDHLIKTNSLP